MHFSGMDACDVVVKSEQMLNVYIIHPKLCQTYIVQFCTDTIDHQNSLLTYINS